MSPRACVCKKNAPCGRCNVCVAGIWGLHGFVYFVFFFVENLAKKDIDFLNDVCYDMV